MLNNLFVLYHNNNILKTLQLFLDHQQAMMNSGNPVPQTPSASASGGARPRTTQTQEDAQFRQKLRHMGKCMFTFLK